MNYSPENADPAAAPPGGFSAVETFRESLDQIVVAFILAFVFRAFVVEAFIIPTGSMAPTLYGEHGSVTCSDCGYAFAYGLSYYTNGSTSIGPDAKAVCPNCRHENTPLRFNDRERRTESGDRILVLKWPLDLGLDALKLKRWDVVVFKDPRDGTTNFIKRLIGVPGEVLGLIDGDVYAVPTAELSEQARRHLEAFLARKTDFQAKLDSGTRLDPLPASVYAELDAKWRIVPKTSRAQDALWMIVYDDDFRPRKWNTRDPQPRWEPMNERSGWDLSQRTLRFDGTASSEADGIELRHITLDDNYGYNLSGQGTRPVEDMRVQFLLTPASATGDLQVTLTKLGVDWTATLGLDGKMRIEGTREGHSVAEALEGQTDALEPGRPVMVSFELVDYRAVLRVGDREALATTEAVLRPELPALREMFDRRILPTPRSPRVFGRGATFELRHLAVHRDVYYTTPQIDGHNVPHGSVFRYVGVWGSPRNPILLRPGEHFCLGDNNPQSQDSRMWTEVGPHLVGRGAKYQLGTVAEDQLIGQAFFVYWPSGHRLSDRIALLGRFGIIPNVGDMRWIR